MSVQTRRKVDTPTHLQTHFHCTKAAHHSARRAALVEMSSKVGKAVPTACVSAHLDERLCRAEPLLLGYRQGVEERETGADEGYRLLH